jgi:tetratricopeptide (TPR) repeat protein
LSDNRPIQTSLRTSAYRLASISLVLALFVVVLPIRLNNASNEVSAETCLRLADHPPGTAPDTLRELERCRSVVPQDVELLADLGIAYEHAGRPGEAEEVYRDALAIDPTYADVHVRVATLLLRRGVVGEARAHAEQALRIQPNRASVQQLLGNITRSGTP